MSHIFGIPWSATFAPHTPVLEIFLRGTVTYLLLFAILRVLPRRETGEAGLADLLVIVLIADAAQNAMAGTYTSLTDGMILVATIAFWSWALNWLAYRFPWLERLLQRPALLLIKDGKLLRRNMRKELVTEEELRSQLRLQGITNIANVKKARMEPDGRLSVVTSAESQGAAPKRKIG